MLLQRVIAVIGLVYSLPLTLLFLALNALGEVSGSDFSSGLTLGIGVFLWAVVPCVFVALFLLTGLRKTTLIAIVPLAILMIVPTVWHIIDMGYDLFPEILRYPLTYISLIYAIVAFLSVLGQTPVENNHDINFTDDPWEDDKKDESEKELTDG